MELELRENMYVRTNDGYINKIKKVNQFNVLVYGRDLFGEELNIPNNEITKASYNIIDILEVGDYVNDKKIVDVGCLTNGPEKGTKVIDYYIAPNVVYYFKNKDIKSIVTKEQMEQMSYKVGE